MPFIACSASDFVEMLVGECTAPHWRGVIRVPLTVLGVVGRGASRIRNLFERARRMAPCIVTAQQNFKVSMFKVSATYRSSKFTSSELQMVVDSALCPEVRVFEIRHDWQ